MLSLFLYMKFNSPKNYLEEDSGTVVDAVAEIFLPRSLYLPISSSQREIRLSQTFFFNLFVYIGIYLRCKSVCGNGKRIEFVVKRRVRILRSRKGFRNLV